MLKDLTLILLRDLDGLRREVDLYPDDLAPWQEVPGMPNSGGNLVLHLVGGVRHFIGATLGRTGYVRNRDAEFSSTGVSKQDLIALITQAHADAEKTLGELPESALDNIFPLQVGGVSLTTRRWLLHVVTHLTYHLGQIDYHRRVVTGDARSAGAVPVAPLGA